MSERVGHLSFPQLRAQEPGRRPYSKWLAAEIDGEVRRMVAEATAHTEAVLRDNYQLLEKVSTSFPSPTLSLPIPPLPPSPSPSHPLPPCPQLAEALLQREVLNYSDLVDLLGPLPHNKTQRHSHELADMW